jgi:hypothetical protein
MSHNTPLYSSYVVYIERDRIKERQKEIQNMKEECEREREIKLILFLSIE